ncbi:cysteine motif protein 5 [Diadegma semiclausum ichnovirus]|nr:cysteine motif protein 5 [Diadegma semiclausum ichnovirus]
MIITSWEAAARTSVNYFNMARYTIAWSMSIWVLTATVMAVTTGPLQTPTSMCIPQGSYCINTVQPCCQPAVLEGFHIRHYGLICFIFGQGLCQLFYEIPQVQLYVELVRKLNATNYIELRRAYRRELDVDPEREFIDSRVLRSLVSDDHVSTISTDSRVIHMQMERNDTVITLTELPVPVNNSSRNMTRKMPVTPVSVNSLNLWRKMGAFPVTRVQPVGEDISMKKVEYNSSRPELPEPKELP